MGDGFDGSLSAVSGAHPGISRDNLRISQDIPGCEPAGAVLGGSILHARSAPPEAGSSPRRPSPRPSRPSLLRAWSVGVTRERHASHGGSRATRRVGTRGANARNCAQIQRRGASGFSFPTSVPPLRQWLMCRPPAVYGGSFSLIFDETPTLGRVQKQSRGPY